MAAPPPAAICPSPALRFRRPACRLAPARLRLPVRLRRPSDWWANLIAKQALVVLSASARLDAVNQRRRRRRRQQTEHEPPSESSEAKAGAAADLAPCSLAPPAGRPACAQRGRSWTGHLSLPLLRVVSGWARRLLAADCATAAGVNGSGSGIGRGHGNRGGNGNQPQTPDTASPNSSARLSLADTY